MGRERSRRDTGRDPGGFVAIPWSVLDSAAYMGLTPTAKALLMEVARQFHRDDNGRMLLSRAYLAKRGWFSAGVIQKAKAELIAAGLIFETVKGCRPNRASWYAVTWRRLDNLPGYDIDAQKAFERGTYRKTPPKGKRPPPACAQSKKNAVLIPPHGTERAPIAPVHGTETPAPVPPHGTIRTTFDPLSVPPHGHPLEVAISGVRIGRVAVDVGSASPIHSLRRRPLPQYREIGAVVRELEQSGLPPDRRLRSVLLGGWRMLPHSSFKNSNQAAARALLQNRLGGILQ